MPPFTLGQAAKAAGRSKATILDAIRAGRLTAPKDDRNRYQIDPAELFRVYPENRTDRTEPNTENQSRPPEPNAETAFHQERAELLGRIIAGLENERDDLRRRLDRSEEARERDAAELRRMTLLLTHERKPPPDAPQTPAPEIEQARQGTVSSFLAVRWPFWLIALVVVAVAVLWLYHFKA